MLVTPGLFSFPFLSQVRESRGKRHGGGTAESPEAGPPFHAFTEQSSRSLSPPTVHESRRTRNLSSRGCCESTTEDTSVIVIIML